jgi:arylsulfotransferase ASST
MRLLPCALSLLALPHPLAWPQAAPPAAPEKELGKPPEKLPEEPRGLRLAKPGAFEGYTLVAPLSSKTTHLVDMQGREVHRWVSEHAPSSVYLLADGSILRHARLPENKVFSGGGICGRIERIGWDGELLWSYELANEDQTSHHDAVAMPNGNVLLITWDYRYREDCVAAGRDPKATPDKGLWPDGVLEIRPTLPEGGEVVWEWHAWDHLVQDFDPAADNHGSIADNPGRIDVNYDHRDQPAESPEERQKREELEAQMSALGYSGGDEEDDDAGAPAAGKPAGPAGGQPQGHGSDWLHTNAIAYSPELDLIAVSSPHLSEVFVLDHSTTTDQAAGKSGGRYGKGGDLLWRWGNPKNHGAGTKADQRLFYQHNVQWIPAGLPGAGHLLVFNNGQERPDGEYSAVLELALPLEPGKGFTREGPAFGPKEPVWSYVSKPDFYAAFISGCQRLPNGNTLVCEGPEGHVFEVTAAGEVVWDWANPLVGDVKDGGVEGHAMFRATRVGPDHPGLKGRTLTPVATEPAR